MITIEILKKDIEAIEAGVNRYNDALGKNDNKAMTKAEEDIKAAEKVYREDKTSMIFDDLKVMEEPILEAVKMHSFLVYTHKLIKVEGVVTGMECSETKRVQIDLVKFANSCGLPSDWVLEAQKFNKLLCLRTAKELGISDKDIAKIDDSFAMNKLLKAKECGETPDSNTKLLKALQGVIDKVLFTEATAEEMITPEGTPVKNPTGTKNRYRANNSDVKYLVATYTKKGKTALSVAVSKNKAFIDTIADVLHRITTDNRYSVEYQAVKQG